MNRLSRRTLLGTLGTAGVVGVGTAGCLGGDADTGDNGDDGGVETDVAQLGASATEPRWASLPADDPPVGYVTRLTDESELSHLVDIDPGDLPDDVRRLLEEADVETDRLLFVQSAGPDTCHDELEVTDVASDGRRLTGSASVVEDAPEDGGCGGALTYPAALVRVVGEDLPDEIRLTVTDGWGESADVDADEPMVPPDELPGHVRPDGEPEVVPAPLDCEDDDVERHADFVDDETVTDGDVPADEPAFAMRIESPDASDDAPLELTAGDEVRITLVNVSTTSQETGNRHKYALQLHTEAGWEEIRVRPAGEENAVGYTDEAIGHGPGDGFEWSFELTADGLLDGHPYEDTLSVCPDLQPGRYRFAFWGLIDDVVAVEFDLVE